MSFPLAGPLSARKASTISLAVMSCSQRVYDSSSRLPCKKGLLLNGQQEMLTFSGAGNPSMGCPAPANLQERQSFPKRRKPNSGTANPVFPGQIRVFGELPVDVAVEVNPMLAQDVGAALGNHQPAAPVAPIADGRWPHAEPERELNPPELRGFRRSVSVTDSPADLTTAIVARSGIRRDCQVAPRTNSERPDLKPAGASPFRNHQYPVGQRASV